MYTNCDTLTNNISEFIIAIEHNNLDIVVITEVTPKNSRYTLQKSELEMKLKGSTYLLPTLMTRTRGGLQYILRNQLSQSN